MARPADARQAFAAALRGGDAVGAWSALAATEPPISLEDSLGLLVTLAGGNRFDRAAVRWVARVCDETPGLTLERLDVISAALLELAPFPQAAPLDEIVQALPQVSGDTARVAMAGSQKRSAYRRHPHQG